MNLPHILSNKSSNQYGQCGLRMILLIYFSNHCDVPNIAYMDICTYPKYLPIIHHIIPCILCIICSNHCWKSSYYPYNPSYVAYFQLSKIHISKSSNHLQSGTKIPMEPANGVRKLNISVIHRMQYVKWIIDTI